MTAKTIYIPIDRLHDDPDVQLAFAYSEKRAMNIAARWNPQGVGIITVTPNGKDDYAIIDGRHRVSAARKLGEPTSLLAEVVPGPLSAEEKSRIKLLRDQQRRRVSGIEHFLVEVSAGDEEANEIVRIAAAQGWEIGPLKNGKPHNRLQATEPLHKIYQLGEEHLTKTLELASLWKGQERANQGDWLMGLAAFVSMGYYDRLRSASRERLRTKAIPAIIVNDMAVLARGSRAEVPGAIAERLRSAARLSRYRTPVVKERTVADGSVLQAKRRPRPWGAKMEAAYAYIEQHPGISTPDLQEALGIRDPQGYGLVTRLQTRKWITGNHKGWRVQQLPGPQVRWTQQSISDEKDTDTPLTETDAEGRKLCGLCQKPIPSGLRPEAEYCGKSCRQKASKARLKEQERSEHVRY